MIEHYAFFDALGSLDEKDSAWRPTLAGLAVLRLFDSSIERSAPQVSDDWQAFRAASDLVATLPEGNPARAILGRILNRLSAEQGVSEELARDVLSFGRSLDLEGRWTLAADVFHTVAERFSSREHPEVVIESCTALGAAARHLGDWETSAMAYARAQHLADTIGDVAASLTVEVGVAGSHMIRGNLPAADAVLANVLAESRARGLQPVEALALHAQASAAHSRGDYQRAIHLAYRSLELTTDATPRDRILSDIAAAYSGLGMYETARDGYLIVAATSLHQWVRWQATLNLMELAARGSDEGQFDDYVTQMETAALDARLRAYFLFFVATGSRHFGRPGSDEQFRVAEQFASRNDLHQIVFEIEAEMQLPLGARNLEAKAAPTLFSEDEPGELERVAEELQRLRERATA